MKFTDLNTVTNQHHSWCFLVILQKFREIEDNSDISKHFGKIREINWIWCAMDFIPREFCVQFHCTKKSLGKKVIARNFPSIWRIFWKHQKLLPKFLYSKPCDNIFLLHEPEGCNEIASRGWMCNGSKSSRGRSPRDDGSIAHSPKGCIFIATQGLM